MENLVNYSSSDSDQEEDEKDEHRNILKNTPKHVTQPKKPTMPKLPLPSTIQKLFGNSSNDHSSNLDLKHAGRKRTFEHVEGNWPTYFYVVPNSSHFDDFLLKTNEIIKMLQRNSKFKIHNIDQEDMHISISKTVPIRHYWIEPMKKHFQESVNIVKQFQYSLCSLTVYTNDEKTRTFVAFEVWDPKDFSALVNITDKIYESFDLEKYYENPSYHVSFAWSLGDKKAHIEELLAKCSNTDTYYFICECIVMKTGNKLHKFFLS